MTLAGRTLWRASFGDLRVAFLGQGWSREIPETVEPLLPSGIQAAYLRQIHSAQVLDAKPGLTGEGDALITDGFDLALTVVTADCVPILLASKTQIAAVHAGWRGLEQNIIATTLKNFQDRAKCRAWVGPCIGACCYEVGEDVATRVQAATPAPIRRLGRGEHPHLDLFAAAEAQLAEQGVTSIERVEFCTHCETSSWHSYRRNGAGAGRNMACIWREENAGD